MWYVYLLQCVDGTLYCGITNDLNKRLKKHNAGKASKYTRTRLPCKMVWSEEANSQSNALRREMRIKKLSRKQKLEIIMLGKLCDAIEREYRRVARKWELDGEFDVKTDLKPHEYAKHLANIRAMLINDAMTTDAAIEELKKIGFEYAG